MSQRRRGGLLVRLLAEVTEADRATFARGITIGALVGAALAGSVLRARRARRRPHPVLRVDGPPEADPDLDAEAAPAETSTPGDEPSDQGPGDAGASAAVMSPTDMATDPE